MTLAEAEAKPRKSLFAFKPAAVLLGELDAAIGNESPKSSAARAIVLAHIRKALTDARHLAEVELLASGKGTRCAQNLSAQQDEIIAAVHLFATSRVYPVDN